MKLSDNVFGMQVAFFFAENSEISILDLATEVKGLFRAMFPNDPQMFLLPDDAPKDIPRCIFQKSDGSAKLSFGLARMDFNAGLKEATPWKNNFEIVIYALAQICKNKNIGVTRIGLVVQTFADKEFEKEIDNLIQISSFTVSDEKNVFWVDKIKDDSNLNINLATTIQINCNNSEKPCIISIDANTSAKEPLLYNFSGLVGVGKTLLSKIEERLENVLC